MPGPVIIAGCFEVVLPWLGYQGVKPRNVLHFHSATGTVAQLAADLSTNLTDTMFLPMHTGQFLNSVIITPMDGSTASAEFPITQRKGGGTGEVSPASAAIVSLRTGVRGSKGRGRVYIGPCTESEVQNGLLAGADAANMTTAWNTFSAAMTAAAGVFDLAVASKKHAIAYPVTSLHAEAVIGTQRRRQSQLR